MKNPVNWFEIYVNDMTRALRFYETVFGSELTKLESDHMPPNMEYFIFPYNKNMEVGMCGTGGALVKMDGCGATAGGTVVYFSCEDCAIEASRVAPSGGIVFKEKFSIGENGFIALVQDTEGNTIGLHSMQ